MGFVIAYVPEVDVELSGVTREAVTAIDRACESTPAFPGVADPPEHVAPKLSARLLQAHGADTDSVQGHAA